MHAAWCCAMPLVGHQRLTPAADKLLAMVQYPVINGPTLVQQHTSDTSWRPG